MRVGDNRTTVDDFHPAPAALTLTVHGPAIESLCRVAYSLDGLDLG